MSARKKSKGKIPGMSVAEPPTERERLCLQLQGNLGLLDALLRVDGSPNATVQIEEAKERLRGICTQQQDLLQVAEEKIDELTRQNEKQRKQIKRLQHKVDSANYELRRALGIRGKPKDATGTSAGKGNGSGQDATAEGSAEEKATKKRGAPKGHRGASRKVPRHYDHERFIEPVSSCNCGCESVTAMTDFDVRYVEDIPPVAVTITREIYGRGQCNSCGKILMHPQVKGPPVVTGPNLAAHLTMLNQMGMTFGKLASLSTNTLGIPLSRSGVLGIVNRVVGSLEGVYGDIAEGLREQPWLNGDETGWKVRGVNGYIWVLCNKHLAYFHHDFSRSANVIKEILGEQFSGIVICDFYAGYNWIDKTQRCLVHLLRDIKKEREILKGSKMLDKFDKAVKDFIAEGLKVQAMPDGPEKDKALKKVEKQLDRLACMKVTKGKATTLVKRIATYRDNLIRFVTHPDVEFHNNRAERQIRPMVINRKLSFGSDTPAGAHRYCILHTIIETCKLQGLNPIDFLRLSYESDGLGTPQLSGLDPPLEKQTG